MLHLYCSYSTMTFIFVNVVVQFYKTWYKVFENAFGLIFVVQHLCRATIRAYGLYLTSSYDRGLFSITSDLGLSINNSRVTPPRSSKSSCIASYMASASAFSEKHTAFLRDAARIIAKQ